jgi:hypothetical protein
MVLERIMVTLIKEGKEIFLIYMELDGSVCKVIYKEGLANI